MIFKILGEIDINKRTRKNDKSTVPSPEQLRTIVTGRRG